MEQADCLPDVEREPRGRVPCGITSPNDVRNESQLTNSSDRVSERQQSKGILEHSPTDRHHGRHSRQLANLLLESPQETVVGVLKWLEYIGLAEREYWDERCSEKC